jgi:hypothetical protein
LFFVGEHKFARWAKNLCWVFLGARYKFAIWLLGAICVVEAESEDEGGDVVAVGALTGQTRDILEWRTSYRSTEPEDCENNFDKTLAKLTKGWTAFKGVLPRIEAAGRRMEWRPDIAAAAASRVRARGYDASKREAREAAKAARL